jgi:hypothetical protein
MVPSVLGERPDERRILPKSGRWSRLEVASKRIFAEQSYCLPLQRRAFTPSTVDGELARCVRRTSLMKSFLFGGGFLDSAAEFDNTLQVAARIIQVLRIDRTRSVDNRVFDEQLDRSTELDEIILR